MRGKIGFFDFGVNGPFMQLKPRSRYMTLAQIFHCTAIILELPDKEPRSERQIVAQALCVNKDAKNIWSKKRTNRKVQTIIVLSG